MDAGWPSSGVPELQFMLACPDPAHKPDLGLGKGVFRIDGKLIGRMSIGQLLSHIENIGKDGKTGCGNDNCQVSLKDALYDTCEDPVICFRCEDNSTVDPHEACKVHDETNATNLVKIALARPQGYVQG